MFQKFIDTSSPEQGRIHIPQLREKFADLGLSGFILPRADEYCGENLAAYAERLAWLTGFTGSAGTTIILQNKAAIFIDGRYTIQVREQVDLDLLDPVSVLQSSPAQWLEENVQEGDVIGFDPWLHTQNAVEKLEKACTSKGARLKALSTNPVDALWTDQPARPDAPIVPHELKYAGQSAEEKIAAIASDISKRADATFITQGDSVAWLFNIRGADVPRAPLPLAYGIVTAQGAAYLITDPAKIDALCQKHLPENVTILANSEMQKALGDIAASAKNWLIDPAILPFAIKNILEESGASLVKGSDPCLKPKAVKNEAELQGMRSAHLRDGIAMVRFLAWLDQSVPAGELDEITCVENLENFRKATGCLEDISFESISCSGPNGALCHYHVSQTSNRKLDQNSLYLIDSGGQYLDGTTDITRTIAIGEPSEEMKDRFTRVLKGMIDLTLMRFPEGTSGSQLDSFARKHLWEAGLDFAHGTGHGVGSYLCVHEGPHRISKVSMSPLEAGNVLSNEPGYYKEGHYGIRTENLVIVSPAKPVEGGDLSLHSFETLTLCPIDRRLIIPVLLTTEELNWLNDYHQRVFAELSSDLDEEDRHWLAEATKPIH